MRSAHLRLVWDSSRIPARATKANDVPEHVIEMVETLLDSAHHLVSVLSLQYELECHGYKYRREEIRDFLKALCQGPDAFLERDPGMALYYRKDSAT